MYKLWCSLFAGYKHVLLSSKCEMSSEENIFIDLDLKNIYDVKKKYWYFLTWHLIARRRFQHRV